jgi:hypothetical protein
MTVARVNIGLLVPLVAFFVATPFAAARPDDPAVREAVREAQQYQKDERPSGRNQRFHDSYSAGASSNSDASKKSGRMSLEERRALRQQINEASQDLNYRRR